MNAQPAISASASPVPLPIRVRAYDEEQDQGFVFSAYMKDLWNNGVRGPNWWQNPETGKWIPVAPRLGRHSPSQSYLTNDVFRVYQKRDIEAIMERAGAWVAVNPADPWHCYGFVIAEQPPDSPPVLHYIYVKGTYRRMGIARALLSELIADAGELVYTHHTNNWPYLFTWLKASGVKASYNPYLAR